MQIAPALSRTLSREQPVSYERIGKEKGDEEAVNVSPLSVTDPVDGQSSSVGGSDVIGWEVNAEIEEKMAVMKE